MAGTRRGGEKLKITVEQRKVLLQRLRREVGDVVEDLNGTAETMRVLSAPERRSPTEQAAARLIGDEQARLRGELVRLWGEYDTLGLGRTGSRRVAARQAA